MAIECRITRTDHYDVWRKAGERTRGRARMRYNHPSAPTRCIEIERATAARVGAFDIAVLVSHLSSFPLVVFLKG